MNASSTQTDKTNQQNPGIFFVFLIMYVCVCECVRVCMLLLLNNYDRKVHILCNISGSSRSVGLQKSIDKL